MKKIFTFALLSFVLLMFLSGCRKNDTVLSVPNLKKAIEINELSTAQFVYNGIARLKKGGSTYHIRYKSTVKAGISMSDVDIAIDEANKVVNITLPEITVHDVLLVDDFDYIPSNPNVSQSEVREACKKDALKNARQSHDLFEAAMDNVKTFIRALTVPIIEKDGYHLNFSVTNVTKTKEAA